MATPDRVEIRWFSDFCTSTKVIKWQLTVSFVPDLKKTSRTPNTSYMAACSSLLNTAPHPFIQTFKCIRQLTRWWKSLAEGPEHLKEQTTMSLASAHSLFPAFSLPSYCPNNPLPLKTEGKGKQGNSHTFDQLDLRAAVSASKPPNQ